MEISNLRASEAGRELPSNDSKHPGLTTTEKFFKGLVAVILSMLTTLFVVVSVGILIFLTTFKGCC